MHINLIILTLVYSWIKMHKIKIKVIFWDLDGTLIKSEHLFYQAAMQATSIIKAKLQIPIKPLTGYLRGLENRAIFDKLFGGIFGSKTAIIFNQWEGLVTAYVLQKMNQARPISQALALFKHLNKLGISQAVVSNSGERIVLHSLALLGILEQCSAIFSRDSVAQGKPNPQLYLNAVKYYGQNASQCLAFEDSATGISAAKAAGIPVIGVGKETISYQPLLTVSLSAKSWWPTISKLIE
jgi:beta-phosphoglucomutase